MINLVLSNIIRFVALVLFQVLILSNIHVQVSFYINPYIYPLFLLLLPIQTPSWLVLLIAFITGLTVDMFLNTVGMHAAACVMAGFLRPYVIRLLTPRNGYEAEDQPTIKYLGYTWFITYALMIIAIHHFVYFFIEVYALNEMGRTLLKIILSTFFSLLLILLIEIIVSPRSRRKYEYN